MVNRRHSWSFWLSMDPLLFQIWILLMLLLLFLSGLPSAYEWISCSYPSGLSLAVSSSEIFLHSLWWFGYSPLNLHSLLCLFLNAEHSLNKCLLSAFYTPGTKLSSGYTTVMKSQFLPSRCLHSSSEIQKHKSNENTMRQL